MKCVDIERFVDSYLDNEFGDRETAEVDAHLGGCETCRVQVEAKRALGARVKQVAQARAPEHLRDNILARLDELEDNEPLHGGWRDWRGWRVLSLSAAAVMLVGLATAGLMVEPSGAGAQATGHLRGVVETAAHQTDVDKVVSETLDWHRRTVPMEVTSPRSEDVRVWFHGKVDFAVPVPSASGSEVNLVGGRLANVGSQQAALINMAVHQRKVSVLVFPGRPIPVPKPTVMPKPTVEFRSAAGYNVAIVRRANLTYSVASDLPQRELRRLVHTVAQP